MKRVGVRGPLGYVSLVAALAVGCLVLIGAPSPDPIDGRDSFNGDLYALLYAQLASQPVRSVQDLVSEWEADVAEWLPVAPPTPDLPLYTGAGRSLAFDPESLPASFVKRLKGVVRTVGE